DWATEEEILRRLQERQAFVREQIAMIPDVPDRPATDRLEQYELQFERLADTIGRVRAAFQRIHAAPRPAGVGTGEPPPSPR
ncbi:MAG: hypothetical protein N2652_07055, partial [Kiritimatiellae bacterium]|nr:hypothetical protein [Kiritimatiellia bacterium]